jgi:hypothetical protein
MVPNVSTRTGIEIDILSTVVLAVINYQSIADGHRLGAG